MIYVLAMIFNSIHENPAVRVSTLIDQLDEAVRVQASLFKSRKTASPPSSQTNPSNDVQSDAKADNKQQAKRKRRTRDDYTIAVLLVEFLISRELISLNNELSINESSVAKKKKNRYYIPMSYYAICNFDLSLLPIKLNLPMVCKPLDWEPIDKKRQPSSLSDLSGGYLSGPTAEMYYHRYQLLTSRDMSHFYIILEYNYNNLCKTMNTLQSQAFEINTEVLTFIKENNDRLVKSGLLMPSFLASVNIKEATDLLRKCFFQELSDSNKCTYNKLLNEFLKRVQRARYETFILNLASAYEGYRFYLPAFLDFRGRIYRSGVLHFHERDLARSLIVFSGSSNQNELDSDQMQEVHKLLTSSAAFHYMKFTSYDDAHQWYLDQKCVFNSSEDSLIQFAVDASKPFQFISNVLCIEGDKTDPTRIPITQDASASAYQLMSYLLLNKEMGMRTNLIPTDGRNINDVYTFFLEELKDYFKIHFDPALSEIICPRITRQLVKGLFMPMIYGKTIISMTADIKVHFSTFLSASECYKLASHCSKFWNDKFPDIINLMKLVRNIGWFSSARDLPVYYSIPTFTTVQDYMKSKAVNIWLYDRLHKKRRQVTLRIPTDIRDRRKTDVATFANFIHQKDAWIAMNMVERLHNIGAPVYTVHDNFITNAIFAKQIPLEYILVFNDKFIGNPLHLINRYIDKNLCSNYMAYDYNILEPIPLDILKHILEYYMPKDLSKKQKLTWDRKIDSIVEAYKSYVHTVCIRPYKTETEPSIIDDKWANFIINMYKWSDYDYIYCLHL